MAVRMAVAAMVAALILSCADTRRSESTPVIPLQQEPPDVARLIEALGEDSLEQRDKAQAQLIALGPGALPEIKKSADSGDAEIQMRVKVIVAEIERVENERKHDADQRPAALHLNDPKKDADARTDGARFFFKTREYQGGLVLDTTFEKDFEGDLKFDVAAITNNEGKELKIQRCGVCSPGLVYVENPGPIKPKITGIRRWFSAYEVEFAEPQNGHRKKVGDFTIEVDWPELRVMSRRGWPKEVMDRVGKEFKFEVKPGHEKSIMGDGFGRRGGGRFGRGFGARKGWCRCTDGPSPVIERKVELVREANATASAAGEYNVDEIAKIVYAFKKPIEENFEVQGPERPAK